MPRDIFSKEITELLQTHFDHLAKSAISPEIIRERGYISALGKTPLRDAGFSPAQQRPPGILIPVHGVDGSMVGHQYRPDHPRTGSNGRIIKYENPRGASVRLDVPPRCRQYLGDPSIDLWFTEGVKKVDSLVTAGACAVGLTGVWGFKGKNVFGGTTLLADFDYIAYRGRVCRLVFDSDLAHNPMVKSALDHLAEHLKRKGAEVHTVFLPGGADGQKVGADDYLAAGHTLDDLKALETKQESPSVRRSSTVYAVDGGCFVWVKQTPDGETNIPLCNFTARVDEDILRDNGAEQTRFFKISGKLPSGADLIPIETTAAGFNSLNWVTAEWGMKAVIAAGQSTKDRLREAIQIQSHDARQRTIYTHTGWREIDGERYFLSGAGALGREDIEVELDPHLQRYQLTEPSGDPLESIKKSFDFVLVASPEVTMPLWAMMYLSPLTEIIDPAFTLWLVGGSGSFKSTLSALALCHYGDFDTKHLPAAWRDTGNHLEKALFLCKDLPLVIDDWAPGQDSSKARELEVKAEYIVRAQGNRQGRGRMRADTTSRPNYAPRGLLVTSGEQLPSGHSHTARIYSVEIEREDIDIGYLSAAQTQQYFYCKAMSFYIVWLKNNWQRLKETLPGQWREYRDRYIEEYNHPRLPEVIAGLNCAVDTVTAFALEYGAITSSEAESYRKMGQEVFLQLAELQSGRIENERPGKRAMELWRAMLDQGFAVFWNKDDESPRTPVPGTRSIGWVENSNGAASYLLNPKAAYGALVDYGQKIGQPFTFKEEAVWKDLKRMALTECEDTRITKVAWIYGAAKRVISLKKL